MAREFTEIASAIEADKATKPELAALGSTSATSLWGLIRDVVARAVWVLENMMDVFSKEIDDRIAAAVPGTDRWLAGEARKFQYGDPLVFDSLTSRYYYQTPDPAKNIISQVAVQSAAGTALVKVTKADGPLTVDEMSAFRAYLNQVQFAGSNVAALSRNPDRLRLPLAIYYDANYELPKIKTDVEAAILAYLQNLPFNGVLRLSALTDAVQAVPGVKDVTHAGVEARPDLGDMVRVARLYNPLSGQVTIDPDYPLATTITYAAE